MDRSIAVLNTSRPYMIAFGDTATMRLRRSDYIANEGVAPDRVAVVKLPRRLFRGKAGYHATWQLERGMSLAGVL